MTFNRIHLIRQVDLFSLKLFLSAVEEEQIGRAAIRENISASTATKRIQDLEEIAGIQLLERTPSGVTPTPAGKVMAEHVRKIFDHLDDLRTGIDAFTEGVRGEVTVSSARSIIAPFLAKEIGDFSREFPGVDVIVQEVENASIIHAVAGGEADLGVFAETGGLDLSGVDVVRYREDRLVALVPRNHPLSDRGSVAFDDLHREGFIPVAAMMGAFETAAAKMKRNFKPKYVIRGAGSAMSLVQAGLGVTVLPECLLSRDLFNEVAVLDFAETWAKRFISIATARGRSPGPATAAFIRQLLDRPGERAVRDHET